MKLEGKVAIITGAAQGIGAGVAREFLAEGCRVMIADIQKDKGAALAAELGGSDVCRFCECDVTRSDQVQALLDATLAAWGAIDIVVCNSGISRNGTILEISEEDFDEVIAVNLKGAFLVGRAGARWMVDNGVHGTIINMSSINAVVCSPTIVPYTVSKGGLNQLTAVMALGLAPHGIRVNGVGPGSIDTELLSKIFSTDPDVMRGILSRTPMQRLGTAKEIGRICVFLASEDSSYMTGQTIYADGGRLKLAYNVPVKEQAVE
ncbi:SDR family oxidoreductase [Mesorhizobium sp. LNJC394B00]|uniref:SDR family NAD(P)-dependent oxidoreductase n=1 Tax=Mesorhizobium sp. LNJC394B00 TaxID=1287274 RepID=UPI0003CE26C4|nr:SDR family oxidoreductase [Mesorhizobium sp. LNJC394B00]ESY15327.1 dehydrogenase [Mesorhizobium sp. LNJC394B00]